ncbi:MAG: Npun_F5749 family FMN-dependent PPOX-type flavoprotein [Cyanobacteria bacterium P01_A01_bin.84]
MSLPPWRSYLARALKKNRSQTDSRYFQLATVKPDGLPGNRTVVFRGFLENTNKLKIITDSRSEKFTQINHQPWGEICWYFTVTREQFRIFGKLILVNENEANTELKKARQIAWQEISDNARVQFAWAHPGEDRVGKEAFSPPLPDVEKPLENFCLLLVDPQKIDHLELRGEPQNRCLYILDERGHWLVKEVNP